MVRLLLAAATTVGFVALSDPGPTTPLPGTGVIGSQNDYRFTKALRSGQELAISNIDGNVTVTQGTGNTAEITVKKRVIRGNGDLVAAIMEETDEGIRVCTVYLNEPTETRTTCRGRNSNNRRHEPLEVEMTYTVSVPRGVRLASTTVDGDLRVEGLGTPANITTVDGDITYQGVMPERVSSVDGDVTLTIEGAVTEAAHLSTVDGDITLFLGRGVGVEVRATSVDGDMESDFPLTVRGKWGPQNMQGTINGGGPSVRLSTVDGSIRIRQTR